MLVMVMMVVMIDDDRRSLCHCLRVGGGAGHRLCDQVILSIKHCYA